MTREQVTAVLEKVRSWPEQDQEELAELAREIEARRSSLYVMNDDEREAVAGSLESPLANEDDVAKLWKSRGIE